MSVFLARHLLTLIAPLLGASVVVFAMLEILPGNAAQVLMGPDADPEAVVALAEQLGVSIPKRKKLYRTLKQKIPITQICQGAYYWLWIDRFYIAVQKLTDDSIRYVYLTRIHIRNELLADQRMKRLYSVSLLDLEARRQFTAARRAMERLQTDYALRLSCSEDGGMAQLDLEAAWSCA